MNRRAVLAVAGAFVVSMLIDLVVGYSPFPGYGASLGLFGCIAIVVVSKWIGKVLLDRPEDYYPEDVPPDVHPDLLAASDATRSPAARLDPTSGTGGVDG